MTNKYSSSDNCPFLLEPAGKDYLWGGTRLKTEFGKQIDINPLAETWECSTHKDGLSVVASGKFKGRTLQAILRENPDFMGKHANNNGELPILIKFIDAFKNLSVQVHPNDKYAKEYENGQLGKSEMWYVLDAAPDAELIYGFYHDITKEQLKKSLDEGTVEKYLQKVKIHKNDTFFIEAGTVHAICKGALIAEIQENSNLTYRLFDYNRTDKNGKKRELHIDKALNVVNLKGSANPRQPMRTLKYRQGVATELISRCKYFQVWRYIINTECTRQLVNFESSENTFNVLLCIEGCGIIFLNNGETLNFFKGDCIFVPANASEIKIHGKGQLLVVGC
ncbi:type I phosphomannose isomerase catalytic subunit [Porcipelethomonas sp.]|uniref:type I phosphomannose isomerase catalytic subunit n=1 Tax=Porcipelethomonas sp. TaxID=2981675 RepID=UPI003EF37064